MTCLPCRWKQRDAIKMGVTAMMVGGTFGIAAKAATNNLMKISLRRGKYSYLTRRYFFPALRHVEIVLSQLLNRPVIAQCHDVTRVQLTDCCCLLVRVRIARDLGFRRLCATSHTRKKQQSGSCVW